MTKPEKSALPDVPLRCRIFGHKFEIGEGELAGYLRKHTMECKRCEKEVVVGL